MGLMVRFQTIYRGDAEGSWLTGCGEHEVRATIV